MPNIEQTTAQAQSQVIGQVALEAPGRQWKKREARNRELVNGTFIVPVTGDWKRTICASEIFDYLECPGRYLMSAEGDKRGPRTVGDAVGQAVHSETAKSPEKRIRNLERLLKCVPEAERKEVVAKAEKMLKVVSEAQDRDQANAEILDKEAPPMVVYDSYTKTWWFAKPDLRAISRDERGRYLLIVDEKTTRGRRRSHFSAAFFMGYVARESKALGFTGTVKTVVRYLKDFTGRILETPREEPSFISARHLSERQEQELYGIQITIKKIDETWQDGQFQLNTGGHCKGCPFRTSCPKNREWLEARDAERAERAAIAQSVALAEATVANDGVVSGVLEVEAA